MNLIVYHIFCFDNYLDVVSSQVNRLMTSGLYDWSDRVEVTCVDTENKFQGIDDIFSKYDKINVTKITQNSYEYWPIKKIWDISQNNDGKVFYFHAKGVSNRYKNLNTKETSEWKVKGVNFWREMMEYYLIDNFKDCVLDLETHDNCGVTCINGWYWGNFWWSNLSFIRENKEPIHAGRWYFEDWLNHGRQYNKKEYFHFTWNPYYTFLPINLFKEKNYLCDKSVEVLSAKYGTTGEQQDEGYSPVVQVVQNDVTEIVKQNFNLNNKKGFNFRIDNQTFGDAIHGHKKVLVLDLLIGDETYTVTCNEDTNLNINFCNE